MSRILVVGQGAREHALAIALAKEATVWVAPGNAGTAKVATNLPIAIDNVDALVAAAEVNKIDLVVVGPELPLTLGLVDALLAKGIVAFGPTREGARLEGSKRYMKEVLVEAGVKTAPFVVFDDVRLAREYVTKAARPLVVKADGLAAGKGVVVARDTTEALVALDQMMTLRVFGEAGACVVIEEVLEGDEASFHVVCDGERAFALPPAQDHKRIFDGDQGPNTGGMGAYGPAPIVPPALAGQLIDTVIEPTLAVLKRRGHAFKGCLFGGLMMQGGEARVLEFNVRFGDPETGALVPLLDGSWLELLTRAAMGNLCGYEGRVSEHHALAVVLAAHGYPGKVRSGDVIHGLDDVRDPSVTVLHAGTRARADGTVEAAGGRVLNVVGVGSTLRDAAVKAYAAVEQIRFDGMQFRRDIGARGFVPQ